MNILCYTHSKTERYGAGKTGLKEEFYRVFHIIQDRQFRAFSRVFFPRRTSSIEKTSRL